MTRPDISPAEYAERRSRFMEAIGPDAIAVVPAAPERTRNHDVHYPFRQDSDFRYLTGFDEPDALAVFAPGDADGDFILFTRPRDPEMELWEGRRAGPEGAVRDYGADAAYAVDEIDLRMVRALSGRRKLVYTLGAPTGWDSRVIGWMQRARAQARKGPGAPTQVESLEPYVHEQRLIKSPGEVAVMQYASTVSAQAHVQAMQLCRPGMNEFEIEAEIHAHFARHGMEPGYGSIVAGGDNACILHYTENNALLNDGELLLIDAGGEYRGYTADITRTFPVGGRYTGEQRAIYELVLEAHRAACAVSTPGKRHREDVHMASVRTITAGLVDLGLLGGEVDALIEDESYKQFFMHGTGHWIGMDVHDVGNYWPGEQSRMLEPGMVMTIEPGIYIAQGTDGVDARWHGIGVRIEDDVLVQDGAPRILTEAVPKGVDEIEALMAA